MTNSFALRIGCDPRARADKRLHQATTSMSSSAPPTPPSGVRNEVQVMRTRVGRPRRLTESTVVSAELSESTNALPIRGRTLAMGSPKSSDVRVVPTVSSARSPHRSSQPRFHTTTRISRSTTTMPSWTELISELRKFFASSNSMLRSRSVSLMVCSSSLVDCSSSFMVSSSSLVDCNSSLVVSSSSTVDCSSSLVVSSSSLVDCSSS